MKILKNILLCISIFCTLSIQASDIITEVSPPEPVKNESFYVTFRIKTSGNESPVITFVPSGAKILGKSEEGVSISTIVINGKFTTTREQNYVYELVSSNPNMVILRNIKVDIGGKISTHPDVHITILDQARRIPDAFMEAQVSKLRPFVGEGVDVNYYLYFKTSIAANDVKEFPKLNKFIKRFHHINAPVETVQYRGEVMKRILAYSARIYPEKAGPATIDPMRISVQVIQNDYNSPFGGFGMGSQRAKNVELASKSVAVEVQPLPAMNVPAGFTGLVGEHEFALTSGKEKYLVNEPIELKLEVRGKGALEKFEAPVLYTDQGLEQFDTKGDMTEEGNTSAKKIFEYTYLARQATTVAAREMSLSYFDPSSGRYIEKKIKIPALIISGVAAMGATGGSDNSAQKATPEQKGVAAAKVADNFFSRWFDSSNTGKTVSSPTPLGLISPDFKNTTKFFNNWLLLLNVLAIVLVFGLVGFWYQQSKQEGSFSSNTTNLKKHIVSMKKKGINYSDLYQVISALDKDNMLGRGGMSIVEVLEKSSLTNEAKVYFKKSLLYSEGQSFGKSTVSDKMNFENKFFDELLKKV